ncbi:Nramp family divalent metal transporter [Lentibacillus salinarum]|uniref:Nramp family divalent metal transporter n=1 Tax=Lentibacillus salinarum TaxID=446820 RepID=A0ABW3ZXC5_9BACI
MEQRIPDADSEKSINFKSKLKIIGPGIILAATGIGSGDLVTSTVAGADFGMVLAWAVIIGVSLKLLLSEGVARWTLATGKTILEGWRLLGRWTMGYFLIYVTLFGLIYGAAIATACGIMMHAMFPVMPIWAWAIIHSVAGFLLIWFGRYKIFERVIMVLIGTMFVTVVGSAIMLIPSLSNVSMEAFSLGIPDGSLFRILGIIGGIGGTLALAAYGYWIREKGWRDASWLPIMRLDVSVAYTMTGIFSVSLMIVSTQFLYGNSVSFDGAAGMLDFLYIYGENFGSTPQFILNIGFWAATCSSLIGSWNGIPYLFADFIRIMKKNKKKKELSQNSSGNPVSIKDPAYKFFLAWLTFPSLLLLMFNQPIGLVLLYAALGSAFIPFLAITLLYLLNSKYVTKQFKNNFFQNAALVFVIIVFLTLGINEFM